uniref:Uncharacterized protein n=1 Tax=Myoviridae sp. ct5nJ10 TaxID=2825034 RepID=A0A8S5NV37_9CAUD|nr:MAG TPA: hypothetical protein [Myoviridae sp. ct5nJ10]
MQGDCGRLAKSALIAPERHFLSGAGVGRGKVFRLV